MNFYGKAEEAVNGLLAAFEEGRVPAALAQVFILKRSASPCARWSWNNQLLTAISGYSDARGFRQWQEVGRTVKKGEHAFYILSPIVRNAGWKDQKEGFDTTPDGSPQQAQRKVFGFRGTPVFGAEQTEGEPCQVDIDRDWIAKLPLIEVAVAWGLKVATYNGEKAPMLGQYRYMKSILTGQQRGTAIALGVENHSTWAHELTHAADDRLHKLTDNPKAKPYQEIVAELGGAVLLTMLGYEREADAGGCWEYLLTQAAEAKGDKTTPLDVVTSVVDRTCKCIDLILTTAESVGAPLPQVLVDIDEPEEYCLVADVAPVYAEEDGWD